MSELYDVMRILNDGGKSIVAAGVNLSSAKQLAGSSIARTGDYHTVVLHGDEPRFNVMTQTETECVLVDENVTEYQAEYLRHWHSETVGKTYHWKERVSYVHFSGGQMNGFDLETVERNEFEEDRANHDARAKWVERSASKRVMAIGDRTGVTAVSPEFGSMPMDFDRIMEDLEEWECATAEHQSMIGIG